jgi:hypothetical protein
VKENFSANAVELFRISKIEIEKQEEKGRRKRSFFIAPNPLELNRARSKAGKP